MLFFLSFSYIMCAGLLTGSVYRDFELENGGLPGIHDSSVLLVKTHQLPSEPFKYDRAVLLIR